MFRKANSDDVAKYCDLAYDLALDQTRSCYPVYTDGIKSKEDFIAAAQSGIEESTSELLLFFLDETVEGWIQYFWIPEDHYLQLTACNIRRGTEQALTELLTSLNERFSGYTLYFGFPECNMNAVRVLRENGFQCIEEDWNYSFFFAEYECLQEDQNVVRIGRENFDDFRALYHSDEETYWNCDRIWECLGEWIIFLYYTDGVPAGAVFLRGDDGYYEIFGLAFTDDEYHEKESRAMLVAALNHCKRIGAKYMTFFCEENEQKTVRELGFRCVGKYVCYRKEI